MNYLGWVKNKERELKNNHAFMVSGPEWHLINTVVQDIRKHFNKAEVITLSNKSKVEAVDAVINQPLFRQQVVIIRDVDHFPHREMLSSWIQETGAARDRRTILVLTAISLRMKQLDDRWIPTSPYVAYIDCSPIAEDHLRVFVKACLPQATVEAIDKLIALCCGDAISMMKEMEKLVLYPVVDVQVVTDFVYPGLDYDVVETVIAGDKQKLLALDVKAVDMHQVVSRLTARLIQQLHLTMLDRKKLEKLDLIKKSDVPVYLFKDRMREMRKTTEGEIWRRLSLLRDIDVQIAHGNEFGSLELLIFDW